MSDHASTLQGALMVNELKLPRSVVQALNSLVSECLEAGRLGSYDAANIARRNLEKELAAWNTRADTGRLSELEAEVARLKSALEPFAKLADEVKKDGARPDGRTAWGFNNAELTWGDFRRARAALRSQS